MGEKMLGELMQESVETARSAVDELDDAECRELLAYTLAGAMVGTGRTAVQTLEHLRGLLP